MTEAAGRAPEAGWGAAVGLTVAVLFLSVFNALPMVLLPLALLLLALPSERRGKQAALGALLAIAVVALPGGPLADVSRGWALALGGGFLLATLLRPAWGVFDRAVMTVAAALLLAGIALALSGGVAQLDSAVREHFAAASRLALESFGSRVEGAEAATQWGAAMEAVAAAQWLLFPGLLALESLAALALASWWGARVREGDLRLRLHPLREFRFEDQMIWALILGLALVVAPAGAALTRTGYNLLLVMGGLYALRGSAVLLFLAGGSLSALTIAAALLVSIFLYPLVLTAATLVGLADTWLDVRGRAATAPRA